MNSSLLGLKLIQSDNTEWNTCIAYHCYPLLLPSSTANPFLSPALSPPYTLIHTHNYPGVIIHHNTVAIITNGTLHPLDPLLSIHLLKQCSQWVVFANLLIEVIEAHTHSCVLTGFTLQVISGGAGSLRCPTTTTKMQAATAEIVMCKGKDHEDKSKPIYTFQSQMNVLRSRQTGREGMQNGKKRDAERGLGPGRDREIEFHIGK